MKKTLLLVLSSSLNLIMGAANIFWCGLILVGYIVPASGGLSTVEMILLILLSATVVCAVNLLFYKLCGLERRKYILLAAGMYAVGMVLFLVYIFQSGIFAS